MQTASASRGARLQEAAPPHTAAAAAAQAAALRAAAAVGAPVALVLGRRGPLPLVLAVLQGGALLRLLAIR